MSFRRLLPLLALMLSACAAPERPIQPQPPECVTPNPDVPVDGGLGGTGVQPDDPCRPVKA